MHFLREPLHLASRVTEDDRLSDGQRLIQITQRVQLPLLSQTYCHTLLAALLSLNTSQPAWQIIPAQKENTACLSAGITWHICTAYNAPPGVQ